MARNSSYDADIHPNWAWSLAIQGKTIAEIAKEFGVARSTLNKWISENEELAAAVNEGRDSADAKVEKSLYQRAIGYTVKEKKVIQTVDKDGRQKPAKVEITERVIPPDVTAQIFWLKNRKPSKYRDRQEVTVEDTNISFNILPSSARKKSDNEE